MAERIIRIGKVSAIDYESGMLRVVYPDLDNCVTNSIPYLSFNGEYRMPEVGSSVLVLHLSNGTAAGVVLGEYWNKANKPLVKGKDVYRKDFSKKNGEAFLQYMNKVLMLKAEGGITIDANNITLKTDAGTVNVADIINHIRSGQE